MGLIQRVIEKSGIPTVGITINRSYTEKIKPPRSIHLPWPFGHPLGAPGNVSQQAAVLQRTFEALYAIRTPGEIVDLDWPWQQRFYPKAPWLNDPPICPPFR